MVFPTVAIYPVVEAGNDIESVRNIIVVAGEGAAPSKRSSCSTGGAEVRRRSPGSSDLVAAINGRVDAPVPTQDVPVLTDDYAPTDALLLLFD